MLHWGTFDTIGQHVFLRNFAAFVMTYFDALKVRTIRLDRLLRVNVITALTDSSCSYRLSGRLFILAILLSSVGVMQLHSLMYRVAWFLLWFDQVPLFYLVALATPIASKPVQCTDLVDASESCWGGKKNQNVTPEVPLLDSTSFWLTGTLTAITFKDELWWITTLHEMIVQD